MYIYMNIYPFKAQSTLSSSGRLPWNVSFPSEYVFAAEASHCRHSGLISVMHILHPLGEKGQIHIS